MPRLENPGTYKQVVRATYNVKGERKDVISEMKTFDIVDHFNPLSASQMPQNVEEARKSLKELTLMIGEIKDFTDAEAAFLKSKYPFIVDADDKKVAKLKPAERKSRLEDAIAKKVAEAAPPKKSEVDVNVEID